MRVIVLAIVALLGSLAVAAEDARAVLERAEAAFERGTMAIEDDAVAARSHFAEAAADFALALDLLEVQSPKLLANLGNALLLAGDAGHAVLAYRRAQQLDPTLVRIDAALAHTRKRVGVEFSPSIAERMTAALLAWRGVVPRWGLLGISFAAFFGLWALAAARMLGRGRIGAAALAWIAAAAIVPIGLLLLERRIVFEPEHAVVVAPGGIEGLNGPAAGVYQPSFTRRLPAGVEGVILEHRGEWRRLRLIDGRETWLPAAALESV